MKEAQRHIDKAIQLIGYHKTEAGTDEHHMIASLIIDMRRCRYRMGTINTVLHANFIDSLKDLDT